MVALASHQTAKKWTTETTISAAREKMHCRRGSHQPAQITSIECVVCKVWIAPLAILTLWSVGHHLAALTRLRQLLERKSFSPSVARAPALSVLVNSPYYHTHTRPKRRRRRRRFQKVKKTVCAYVSKCVLVCVCVKCECVCVLHSVIHCEFVPDLERRVQRGNKRPSVL